MAVILVTGWLGLISSSAVMAADIQEFVAEYQVNYGDLRLGKANYRLSHQQGDRYDFYFTSELGFLVFWDERTVRTELVYESPNLLPRYYNHDRRGTGRDYSEEVTFSPSEGIIHSRFMKESEELDYDREIVDGLTVQLQLMLDLQRGISQPRYKILDENRVREREFRFVGEEVVTLLGSDHQTVVYEVVRDNNRRKTQMWFSPERHYLPVQMVHYSKGKKKFNAQLVSYEALEQAPGPETELTASQP